MCSTKRSAKLTVRGVVAQQRERKGEERDEGRYNIAYTDSKTSRSRQMIRASSTS